MGTIWWQLNDTWPVTSWAVVDASGRPKPAWYALRDAYAPRLLTIQPRGSSLAVVAVNDTAERWVIAGDVRRLDVDGRTRAGAELDVVLDAWSCRLVVLPPAVATSASPERELLVAEAGTTRAWWWFVADRDFAYAAPRFDVAVMTEAPGRHRIRLVADRLVRDVALFVDRLAPGAEVDRQLVTALAGEPIDLVVTGLDTADGTVLATRPICRTANDLVV
jgi:beta-mannosidase